MNSMYMSTLNNKVELPSSNKEEIYKNPMPLDMINKFVGLDSRILKHDDVVQKQAFDQYYKNFWSFVDFNMKYNSDIPVNNDVCGHTHLKTTKPSYSMINGKNCTGVTMSYQEARVKAFGQ